MCSFFGPSIAELDDSRIRPRSENKIVFKLPLRPVVNEIDPAINSRSATLR